MNPYVSRQNLEYLKCQLSKTMHSEIKNSGITEAAAEGYWVFLKPLSKGHYSIRFEGSCENGRFSAEYTVLDIV